MRWHRFLAWHLRRAGFQRHDVERLGGGYKTHSYRQGRCLVVIPCSSGARVAVVRRNSRGTDDEWHAHFTAGAPVQVILDTARRAQRSPRIDMGRAA